MRASISLRMDLADDGAFRDRQRRAGAAGGVAGKRDVLRRAGIDDAVAHRDLGVAVDDQTGR